VKEIVSDEARDDQWEFVPETRCSILKRAIIHVVIFKKDRVGGRARVTIGEERML